MRTHLFALLLLPIRIRALWRASPANNNSDDDGHIKSHSVERYNNMLYDDGDDHPSPITSTFSVTNSEAKRQADVWEKIHDMEDYKSNLRLYSTINGDRARLTSFHYIVQPVWWADNDNTDPSLVMDLAKIMTALDQTIQYYSDMSWGSMQITYDILPQQILSGSISSTSNPGLVNTGSAARQLVASQGYQSGVDYDGILLVYFQPSTGELSTLPGGAHAEINSDFVWLSYETGVNYKTMRQEVGHNFGHAHHGSNSYEYRLTRPNIPSTVLDGFDFMSGGNEQFEVADFAVASKWFFNWVSDSNVVHLQPEGSTVECPTCLSEGTFVISAFDRVSSPPIVGGSGSTVMGVHVPIAATVDDADRVYSYWFSYRSGVDGAAENGLSVHLTWFDLGGLFGASYDSMNYDAFGDTDTTDDSFVLEGTCYSVDPAAYLMDRDIVSVDAVRPLICVDSINVGSDVTITVKFLDVDDPPSNAVGVDVKTFPPLECSASNFGSFKSYKGFASGYKLIEVSNTGGDGVLSWQMCPENASTDTSVTAFFFDEYPTSPLAFKSPAAYGAFKSTTTRYIDCCTPGTFVTPEGAVAVKVTNMNSDFLHLNEIEIFDAQGTNVALDAKCYSRTSGFGGSPNCLNDGDVGHFPDACSSHSSTDGADNYDFCILDEPVDIKAIHVYPFYDPANLWMTDRLKDLKVEIFAAVTNLSNVTDSANEGGDVSFLGLLEAYDLSFSSAEHGPKAQTPLNLPLDAFSCPSSGTLAPFTYQSDTGKTWVLIPPLEGPVNDNTAINMGALCKLSECGINEYLDSNQRKCQQCPVDVPRSPAGSKSINDCSPCPDGTVLAHPRATECSLTNDYSIILEASGWRVWAPEFHIESSNSDWEVRRLDFYDNMNCDGDPMDPDVGDPVDSGNAGPEFGPDKAYSGGSSTFWRGRPDSDGILSIGKDFSNNLVRCRCLRLYELPGKGASSIRVQAYMFDEEQWVNAWIEEDLDPNESVHVIRMTYPGFTNQPSSAPSGFSTGSPSNAPTFTRSETPTVSPTSSPSTVPIYSPTSKPSTTPSTKPSEVPSGNVSETPTGAPSEAPTKNPTSAPSNVPSLDLSSETPTGAPIVAPTKNPTSAPTNVPSLDQSSAPTIIAQLDILKEIYDSTGGTTHWRANNWFQPGVHFCDFDRINCVDNAVTEMRLEDMLLQGTIPPIIGMLSNLEYLTLEWNFGLVGTIPTTLGDLKNLQHLELDDTNLTGTLPSELGLLENLRYLEIEDVNNLVGSIPTEFGQLSKMEEMYLYNNDNLVGSIPSEIGMLTSLEYLWLSENMKIAGSIPTEIGLLSSLKDFVVRGSTLTGTIPTQIFGLTSLLRLELDDTNLSGTISTLFGKLTSLQHLELDDTLLSGNIPSELGLLVDMVYLEISRISALQGSLPTEFGLMTKLEELYVYELPELVGTIPTELGSLLSLFELQLRGNSKMTGSLPSEFGKLQSLEYLRISDMHTITGVIPSEMGLLPNLEHAYIYCMHGLSGSIPSEFGLLAQLIELELYDNGDIGGLIPSEFGLLSNLRVLALGHNYYLTGSIPTQLGQLSTNLHVLELEETQLSGTIPTELGALKSLGYLDLERTQLGGAIPSELGSLSNLVELEISSSSFLEGTLPSQLGQLTNLQKLFVHSLPGVTGSIPSEFGLLSSVGTIWVYNTPLITGTIPTELGALDNLVYIWSSNVGITGSIPSEFGLLSSKLEEMYLYDLPGLGGTIPTELENLRLDYLWLNDNALTGPVPAFDFTYLIHLHLDNNMLTGTIAQCGSAEVKADCGGISPEVTCECCSICLVDSTDVPSMTPTIFEVVSSQSPSESPTLNPSSSLSESPSLLPTASSSFHPSTAPTSMPSSPPSNVPSIGATSSPTAAPFASPSSLPSSSPTGAPIGSPTATPTSPVGLNLCQTHGGKDVCNYVEGCSWRRQSKTCKPSLTQTQCRALDGQKGRCKNKGCIWRNGSQKCVSRWK